MPQWSLKHFSVITKALKSENWKSFKDYGVYLINILRISHTFKRNLTKLVYFGKKKTIILKSSYLHYFKEKNREIWNVNSNRFFSIALCKKNKSFQFQGKKRYSETLIEKIATKYLRNQIICNKYSRICYNFNNFFVCEHFYIDFPLFHKHFEHRDQIYSICDGCNWFF